MQLLPTAIGNCNASQLTARLCMMRGVGYAWMVMMLVFWVGRSSNAADDRNQNLNSKSSAVIRNIGEEDNVSGQRTDQVQVPNQEERLAQATFGGGCFWCTEAIFQRVKGVVQVTSGYMGGHVPNPTYQMVLTKKTGHAEVLHLSFDPEIVSYEKLLEIFWKTHDPTTLNRQGNDFGPQYRSVIFFHNEEQQKLALKYKTLLNESKAFSDEIVTEISPASAFYPAEDYHQNYYNLNKKKNSYCNQIKYKLAKFRRVFPEAVDPSKDKVK